jgi:diguanylate cyclase (GGDEF)-like protein
MAIAAAPITRGKNLLDLLRQSVPIQERAIELYRRLLSINGISGPMSGVQDIDQLQDILTEYFQECLHDEEVRLCLIEGLYYRKLRLSGSSVPKDENHLPLGRGIVGSVLKTGKPLWIPDTQTSRKNLSCSYFNKAENLPQSIIILPFSAMGKVVGCLEMTSSHPNRLDEMEYHLGSLVAAHLSSSIENVLTRQELATANAQLRNHDLRLTQLNEKLQQLAHTDEATGLYNKRRLLEQLDMEIARARRYGEIFSCFMIDIDDFKLINDTYGHQAGDEVLRQIGMLLRHSLRKTDFIARYGGEEFTVLLPRTNSAGAFRAAENLRANFNSHEFVITAARICISVSIGVTCCTTFDRLDAQQILLSADNALYRAKRSGKNQVCFETGDESSREDVRILSSL